MRTETMTLDTQRSPANLFTHPELQRVAPGLVLFEEGEQPAGIYILQSGEVVLSTNLHGRSTRMRTAHAGEMLGMMAVVSGQPHLTSAVATSFCEAAFIEAGEFRKLIDASPAVWFSVLRQLSHDVNASYDVIRGHFDGRC